MRILFVTPYPPSRIRVRGYGFLKQLRRSHEVTIAAQCASEQEQADVEKLRREGYEVVVVQESKKRSALRSGRALLGTTPLQVAYARSERFAEAVKQLYEQRGFDAIHVEHLRGIASMETLIGQYPCVWDAVDCISLLSKQTMAEGPSLSVRMVARVEYERTRRYEARMLSLLSSTIVTSERDRQAMIELRRLFSRDLFSSDEALGSGIQVIPNGVDLEYFHPMPQERRRLNLVFSGKMSYHANIATAFYLYRQIMPLIWEQRPEATLTIVGSKPPKAIQALAQDRRVEVTGYVDDLRPYITRAEVMPCPMVYSVGIQNKALEAMALGTPVVVSRQAAESLGAQAGRDLLVADSAREFAQTTLRLLDDAEMRTSLAQHGRVYVEQRHDWQKIADRLADVYRQAREQYDRRGEGQAEAGRSMAGKGVKN
jgi:sugar transferase (PEP-CTERM/EpsH1 system associated)